MVMQTYNLCMEIETEGSERFRLGLGRQLSEQRHLLLDLRA